LELTALNSSAKIKQVREFNVDSLQLDFELQMKQQREIVEKFGKLDELDRSFEIEFWRARSPKERMDAVWELVLHYAKVKGIDVRQLRLERSVENFQKQPR
jgi:hypothetical protein